MPSDRKKRILILSPLFCFPNLPNFKDKYELLSENFEIHVIAESLPQYDGYQMGTALLHVIPLQTDFGLKGTIEFLSQFVRLGTRIGRKHGIDIIVSYDPLTLGLAGRLLKLILKTRLVIEVNGHMLIAGFLNKKRFKTVVRKMIFAQMIRFCLHGVDLVKFLNKRQKVEWQQQIKNKSIAVFHDFVPTHAFSNCGSCDGNYILFVGFPFITRA